MSVPFNKESERTRSAQQIAATSTQAPPGGC